MKTLAPVTHDLTSGQALAVILKHNLDALLSWQDAAHDWADIEGVHQVRVSFRRMRSALVAFKSILPKNQRKAWARTIQDLVNETGPARDIDVLIEEALPAFRAAVPQPFPGEADVLGALTTKRGEAYDTVRAMLDGQSFAAFLRDFADWVETPGWSNGGTPKKKRIRQEHPVGDFAREQLDTLHAMVLERGESTDTLDAAAMHKLRIACKKLRYATEFFTPLYDGMDGYTKNLKAIQDTLGHLHDTAVMTDLLHGLLSLEANPQAERFIDEIIVWRKGEDDKMLGHFARQWDAFQNGACPWRP